MPFRRLEEPGRPSCPRGLRGGAVAPSQNQLPVLRGKLRVVSFVSIALKGREAVARAEMVGQELKVLVLHIQMCHRTAGDRRRYVAVQVVPERVPEPKPF